MFIRGYIENWIIIIENNNKGLLDMQFSVINFYTYTSLKII